MVSAVLTVPVVPMLPKLPTEPSYSVHVRYSPDATSNSRVRDLARVFKHEYSPL